MEAFSDGIFAFAATLLVLEQFGRTSASPCISSFRSEMSDDSYPTALERRAEDGGPRACPTPSRAADWRRN